MTVRPIHLVLASLGGGLMAVLVILLAGFSGSPPTDPEADRQYSRLIREKYRIFSLPLPEDISFAGEKVPVQWWDIRERMDRELLVGTYWQSNMLLCIKRANRWFPVIEPILKENGIPEDFKYLAVIESGLTNAVSPSGATGFWQFIESTAKLYGLQVDEEVDERYHVERSTQAACHFLRDAYDQFGSWAMAAAAYNMGAGGLSRQVERQRDSTYWGLLLNEETARYVFRILAAKEIMSRPDEYGFVLRPDDLYPPLVAGEEVLSVAVPDWAEFARQRGISYKTLKLYNPWLRQTYLKNPGGKSYSIRLPEVY